MVGMATGLAFSVVASLLIGIVGGLLIDRLIGTQPIFTLIGLFFGLGAAGYSLYELAVFSRGGGPVTRKLLKRGGNRGGDE
jgi:F0F1-type ATP synthase assembly protein I